MKSAYRRTFKIQLRNLLVGFLLLVQVLLLVSCGGGRKPIRPIPPPPPPPPPPPTESPIEEYKKELEEKLEPWESPDKGAVKGTLTITGLTILNNQTLEPAKPPRVFDYVLTRIVDPEDDIGSIDIPEPDGTFLHSNVAPLDIGYLEVTFFVAEDLDGDGQGMDNVFLRTPIQIEPQVTSVVDINIGVPSSDEYPDPPTLGAYPETRPRPLKVISEYLGPEGERRNAFAMFQWLGKQIRDLNLNGKFELEEGLLDDRNNDGLIDDVQEIERDAPSLPPASLEGVIEDVIIAPQRGIELVIREKLATHERRVRVLIVERTVVLISSPDGNQFTQAPVRPSELIGKLAVVDAFILPDGTLIANLIIVLPNDEHG